MRTCVLVVAAAVAGGWGVAAGAGYAEAIDSMDAFLVRQMGFFDGARPAGQPPLMPTFGWSEGLAFPPGALNPPPASASAPSAPAASTELYWRGDIYDQSLGAIWFTERARVDVMHGRDPLANLARAKTLLDAGIFLGTHDPVPDGRVRAAYWANNLLNPAGTQASIMAPDSSTGNIAWFGIALAKFYDTASRAGYLDPGARQTYLDAAKAKGQWILDHCPGTGTPGFTGGLGGWGQTAYTWKSTEHNIDVWALASDLQVLTGETRWTAMAGKAAAFVQAMYVDVDAASGYYRTGTLTDGLTPNPSPVPADAQTWTALARRGGTAIDTDARADKAARWLRDNLRAGAEGVSLPASGVKFSDVGKNLQSEMTAGAALALLWRNDPSGEAQGYLGLLDWARTHAGPSYDGIADGLGLTATPCPAGAWTGYGDSWYYDLLHGASSSWFALSCLYAEESDLLANPLAPLWAPHPGDANSDGTVDLQDFGLMKAHFGLPAGAAWVDGDFTGDGAVDLQDFGALKDHFAHTLGDAPVRAVPEPGALTVLALAVAAARMSRRKFSTLRGN